MLLIYPGTKGAPVALQSVLREAHDALRDARARQIEARKKRRVPLDDSTDWQAVGEGVASVSLAHGERDSAAVAKAARELVEMTEGHALEPIGDYEPDAALDGIIVTMAVVADADRRMWSAETAAAWDRVRAARLSGDTIAAQCALNDLDTIAAKVVGAVVVDISGAVDLEGKTVVEAMPALVLAGLLAPLYQAARYFLDLPAPKAVRCGLPPQST
jgi:putative component of toxin-antitoxin plasmid stabilization module